MYETENFSEVISFILFSLQVLCYNVSITLAKYRGIQRQFLKNICSEDDLRPRIFGTFVVKFLACLPLLGFLNPPKMV